jgi:hypothetical protein
MLAKVSPLPREPTLQMQDDLEAHFQQAFQRYVGGLRNSPTLARAATRAQDSDDVDALMEQFQPYIERLAEERRRMAAHVIVNTRKELSRKLLGKADGETDGAGDLNSTVGLSFDPELAAAASLMEGQDLDFIVEFTDAQREAVRTALTRALQTGKGTAATARSFRNSIGLTSAQQSAVDTYEELLQSNSAEALDRILRDSRYDAGLTTAIAAGEPLSAGRIATMVDSYASRYLAMRAETIARTETTRVLNMARQETTMQVVDDVGIPADEVVRTWAATNDKRTRDTHAAMDGQERGLNEPFDSPSGAQLMYPGDPDAPAEEVINCRCAVLISFKSTAPTADETAAAVDEVVADEGG